MSFPPNLGITNSLIIDTECYLIFHEFNHPFSRNKIDINGYAKLEKDSGSRRSKSVDFADLTYPHHKPRTTPNTVHDSIPEQENMGCPEEASERPKGTEKEFVDKGSFPIRRSASMSKVYSRLVHRRCGSSAEDDDKQHGGGLILPKRFVKTKKKGKFFGAIRRFLGL